MQDAASRHHCRLRLLLTVVGLDALDLLLTLCYPLQSQVRLNLVAANHSVLASLLHLLDPLPRPFRANICPSWSVALRQFAKPRSSADHTRITVSRRRRKAPAVPAHSSSVEHQRRWPGTSSKIRVSAVELVLNSLRRRTGQDHVRPDPDQGCRPASVQHRLQEGGR